LPLRSKNQFNRKKLNKKKERGGGELEEREVRGRKKRKKKGESALFVVFARVTNILGDHQNSLLSINQAHA
jgi:hypothetical protein